MTSSNNLSSFVAELVGYNHHPFTVLPKRKICWAFIKRGFTPCT